MRLRPSPTLALTLAGALLAACDARDEAPAMSEAPATVDTLVTARPTVTYLALGDSYTVGESVPQAASFPYQLSDSLTARGYGVAEVTVIARTGWRSDVLLAALDERDTGPAPNLVTLLIGVNDQFQGRDVEGFRQNFVRLLDRAEGLAVDGRGDVVVVTIPDYSATPFAASRDTARIRRELDVFNAVLTEEAGARGLPVVDITPGSKAARERPGELLAADRLHPSGVQYGQWVTEMLPSVVAALE